MSDPAPGTWRKSSRSYANHNCVEMAWRKSSHSFSNSNCVEAAPACSQVLVRDSKNPDGPVLSVGAPAWTAFLDGVRAGDFA
jgi:hypothetical protein